MRSRPRDSTTPTWYVVAVPALKGSLTYGRFFVEGDVNDDSRESVDRWMKSIRLRALRPLEPDDEELERSGWAKLGEPMTTELSGDDVFRGDYVALAFRTDRWQFPGALVKSRLREAESAYLAKKGQARLSRREKTELKQLVEKKLRRTMEPSTRSVDLVWAVEEGVVRFFSHAAKPGERMMELFQKTFGLKLVPESPFTLASRLGFDAGERAAWDALEVTHLGEEEPGLLLDDAAAEEE